MPTAVIVGATAPLAPFLAERFAAGGFDLVLAARRPSVLDKLVARLGKTWPVKVTRLSLDAADAESVQAFITLLGQHPPDVVVTLLGRQQHAAGPDPDELTQLIDSNLTQPAALIERVATVLAAAGRGTIIGVSSIVGDRGRSKNYAYGAGKAGLTAYLSGLRQRLNAAGVRVMTVKPGPIFVEGRAQSHPGWLMATPERVAGDIYRGWARGSQVVYTPGYWRWLMLGVRLIPESMFRRMRF